MTRDATSHAARPPGLSRLLEKLLGITILFALAYLGYRYLTTEQLNEQIRQRVETKLRERYAGLLVRVESARRLEGRGIEIRGVSIAEVDRTQEPMVQIDRILCSCNTALPEFITQPVEVEMLLIDHARMKAVRRKNGFWNIEHLFPVPVTQKQMPLVRIEHATVEIRDEATPAAEPLELREIQLTLQSDPAGAATLGLAEDQAREVVRVEGKLAGDYLREIRLQGITTRKLERWSMRGDVDDLRLRPSLLAELPRDVAGRLTPLAPLSGHAHFSFEVDNLVPPGEPWRFAMSGNLEDGRIDDVRLPRPLTDLRAKVRGDNAGLGIEELQGRLGDAQLAASLRFDGYAASSPLVVRLDVQDFPLDENIAPMVPEPMRPFWRDLGLTGVLQGKIVLQFDGRGWTPQFDGEVRKATLRYAKFPYRLTAGQATIGLHNDLLTVRGHALAGNAKVRCMAEVRNPGPGWSGWAEGQTEESIPLDDRFLDAIPEKTREVVRSMNARGSVQLLGRLDRRAGRSHHQLEVTLQDCSVEYEKFRYPIDHVHGRLRDTDGVWSFVDLRGTQGTSQIQCSGSYGPDVNGDRLLALEFHGTNVALNETLRNALDVANQRLWDDFRPRGELDVLGVSMQYRPAAGSFELAVNGQKLPQPETTVRSIRMEPVWFPYAIDISSGRVEYRDGVVKLHNMRGLHDRTKLEADGTFRWNPQGGWSLEMPRLYADRLQLDHDLLAALPVDAGRALAKAKFQGALAMSGNLTMAGMSGDPSSLQANWNLQFDVEDGRLASDVPIDHIHGSVRLSGGVEHGDWASNGDLQLDSAFVRDVQFTQVRGPFFVDQNQVLLGSWSNRGMSSGPPKKLLAQVFDGLLATDASLALDDDGEFRLETTLEQADLAKIANETHLRASDISGKAFAILQIAGTTRGKHTWRGSGNFRLRDAYLYKVPVMVSLLKLLSVRAPDATAFTTSDVDFRVQGDDLIFDRIDLGGDAISLKGRGRMYEQKQIDLLFYTQVGRYDARVLRPVLAEASPLFLLIEVSGSLDEPQMKKTAFPALNETLRDLFPDLARETPATASRERTLRNLVPLPDILPR